MPRSEKELTELMNKIQDHFDQVWKTGNAGNLSQLYHPEAVLVCTGKWSAQGRKTIEERYASFIDPKAEFYLVFELNEEAVGGEYIIHKGHYGPKGHPEVKLPYEQIYKRQPDGSYLIYHDEFSM